MIYLAIPYSDPDPAVMESRFEAACRVAGAMMSAGLLVFSPICHTHPIAVRCELPRGWEFWRRYDEQHIAAASAVHVAMMDGWKESRGVTAEIEIAKQLGKPVVYQSADWELEKRIIEARIEAEAKSK